jgi:hypothetical protein
MGRVVVKDIDAAELREGFGNDRPAMIGMLDVAETTTAFIPASVTSRSVSWASSRSSQIGDQDVGSLPGG